MEVRESDQRECEQSSHIHPLLREIDSSLQQIIIHIYTFIDPLLHNFEQISQDSAAFLSFTRHRYAGYTGLILGIVLSLWIIIQAAWISLMSPLQPVFLDIGLINTFLGW
jgi:hypothetical protein